MVRDSPSSELSTDETPDWDFENYQNFQHQDVMSNSAFLAIPIPSNIYRTLNVLRVRRFDPRQRTADDPFEVPDPRTLTPAEQDLLGAPPSQLGLLVGVAPDGYFDLGADSLPDDHPANTDKIKFSDYNRSTNFRFRTRRSTHGIARVVAHWENSSRRPEKRRIAYSVLLSPEQGLCTGSTIPFRQVFFAPLYRDDDKIRTSAAKACTEKIRRALEEHPLMSPDVPPPRAMDHRTRPRRLGAANGTRMHPQEVVAASESSTARPQVNGGARNVQVTIAPLRSNQELLRAIVAHADLAVLTRNYGLVLGFKTNIIDFSLRRYKGRLSPNASWELFSYLLTLEMTHEAHATSALRRWKAYTNDPNTLNDDINITAREIRIINRVAPSRELSHPRHVIKLVEGMRILQALMPEADLQQLPRENLSNALALIERGYQTTSH